MSTINKKAGIASSALKIGKGAVGALKDLFYTGPKVLRETYKKEIPKWTATKAGLALLGGAGLTGLGVKKGTEYLMKHGPGSKKQEIQKKGEFNMTKADSILEKVAFQTIHGDRRFFYPIIDRATAMSRNIPGEYKLDAYTQGVKDLAEREAIPTNRYALKQGVKSGLLGGAFGAAINALLTPKHKIPRELQSAKFVSKLPTVRGQALKGFGQWGAAFGILGGILGKIGAAMKNGDIKFAKDIVDGSNMSADLKKGLYAEIVQHEENVHSQRDFNQWNDERRHQEIMRKR